MAPRLSVRATWRQPAWPAEHAARRSPRVAAGAAASAGDAPLARLANAAGFCAALALGGIGALRERAAPQFEFRALAPWPAPKFLRTFPGEFERAFGDRFGGRGALLLLHHRAMVGVFGVSPAPNVMIGRDGWLYFLGEEGQALDRHYRVPIGDAEIAAVAIELIRRQRFLASRGILRLRETRAPARGRLSRLDGDTADSAAVGELQPCRLCRQPPPRPGTDPARGARRGDRGNGRTLAAGARCVADAGSKVAPLAASPLPACGDGARRAG